MKKTTKTENSRRNAPLTNCKTKQYRISNQQSVVPLLSSELPPNLSGIDEMILAIAFCSMLHTSFNKPVSSLSVDIACTRALTRRQMQEMNSHLFDVQVKNILITPLSWRNNYVLPKESSKALRISEWCHPHIFLPLKSPCPVPANFCWIPNFSVNATTELPPKVSLE